jgi:hypothetical protein
VTPNTYLPSLRPTAKTGAAFPWGSPGPPIAYALRRMRSPVNGRWRGSGQSSGSRRPTEPCRYRR